MNVGDDVVIAGKIRAYSKSLGLLVVELPNKEIISVSDKAIKSYRPAIKVPDKDERRGR